MNTGYADVLGQDVHDQEYPCARDLEVEEGGWEEIGDGGDVIICESWNDADEWGIVVLGDLGENRVGKE